MCPKPSPERLKRLEEVGLSQVVENAPDNPIYVSKLQGCSLTMQKAVLVTLLDEGVAPEVFDDRCRTFSDIFNGKYLQIKKSFRDSADKCLREIIEKKIAQLQDKREQ